MEHAFDDAEGVLHAAAGLGLDTITGAFDLVYDAFVPSAAVGEVAGLGSVWPEDIGLALIGRVTPHPGLLAVEEIGQDRGVMDVGGSGHRPYGRHSHGMDDLGLAVDAYMAFTPFRGFMPKYHFTPYAFDACRDRALCPGSLSTKGRG